jgi:hypothetical protein
VAENEVISKGGDIVLRVRDPHKSIPVDFLVSKGALSSVSPYFEALLSLNESQPYELEAEVKPLQELLHIAHWNHTKVSKSVTCAELYGIVNQAVLFDMFKMLPCFCKEWLRSAEENPDIEFVSIYYELGAKVRLEYMIDKLVKSCKLNSDKKLITRKGVILEEGRQYFPDGILGKLSA